MNMETDFLMFLVGYGVGIFLGAFSGILVTKYILDRKK